MGTVRVSVPILAFSGLMAMVGSACGPADQDPDTPSVQIDHVIVAVGDLQMGIERFEELTGIRPVFGGEHPGRGTRNALVSLGPRIYLELLAPQEGVEEVEDAPGLPDLTELTPWGWAASTADLDATLAHLRADGYEAPEPIPGSRATPDGGLLKWRTSAVGEPVILGAPFFIEWDVDSPHPATTSPRGCELEALKVLTPNAEELTGLAGLLGLRVGVEAAASSVDQYELTLRCPTGPVTF